MEEGAETLETLDHLALARMGGLSPGQSKALLDYFGSAAKVLQASEQAIQGCLGSAHPWIATFQAMRAEGYRWAQEELIFAQNQSIQVRPFSDPAYPGRLAECADAPPVLFYKGAADLNASRVVSIIGSEKMSRYGENICMELIQGLLKYKVLVLSTLASGIDAFVHERCLALGIPSVAVLPRGLDQVYPAKQQELSQQLLKKGGLLSEFPSQTKLHEENFPRRDRLIVGLADVVIAVEAGIQSREVFSLGLAAEYNRDACAFPGHIYQRGSTGCNFLIKSHQAQLISGVQDLAYLMNWEKDA